MQMLYYVMLGRDPTRPAWPSGPASPTAAAPACCSRATRGFATRIQILGPGTPNQGFIGSPEFQGLFAN